jgi:ATP-dependent RNA/DNA helicase IGHMBP2
MDRWLETLRAGVASEAAAQEAEVEAVARLPWPDRVALGAAWPGMRVVDAEPAGGRDERWHLQLPRGALHEGLGPGERVGVARSPQAAPAWWGRVDEVGATSAVVRVQAPPDEPPPEVWVGRAFDAGTFRRQDAALARAAHLDTPLVQVLCGGRRAGRTPLDRDPDLAGLDAAQADAVRAALEADTLALIHGPPGTGKTRTLVALLRALVADGERPWALADSNAAVDHLAAAAAGAGLEVVRLGPVARVSSRASALTVEARLARHPLRPALTRLEAELRKLRAQGGRAAWAAMGPVRADLAALRTQARSEVMASAQVFAATFGTLGRVGDELGPCRTAVVDEATQATEPATWIAAVRVQRLILAGDPHQLGPVVTGPATWLADSLLHRVHGQDGVPAVMLEVQRRMNDGLRALLASVYGPRWRSDPGVAGRVGAWPVLRWIDTSGSGVVEVRDPRTQSLYHPIEVQIVARAVAELRQKGVSPDAIGVIAPYAAQVERLRARPELAGVEVATVNAFQGREKEVMVVSFVRSNDDGEVGFVGDARRAVVALSRARSGLCAVGDASTLARVPLLASVLDQLSAAGAVESVWDEAWADLVSD